MPESIEEGHNINSKREKGTKSHNKSKNHIKRNIFIFGLLNLGWFLFRSGSKPTRIVYPCQQAAANNATISFTTIFGSLSISAIWIAIQNFWSKYNKIVITFSLFLFPITLLPNLMPSPANYEGDIDLTISPSIANNISTVETSDIFVVNGRNVSHMENLLVLMNSQDFKFYKSDTVDLKQGPDGLISSNDVVVLKINCQWSERGGTNTDLLKEVIQSILNHPSGFNGEIIVSDNGQGRGRMNWPQSNSITPEQSAQDVVNAFEGEVNISTYLWDNIRNNVVQEYEDGDTNSGYIMYDTPDNETGIIITYPKFQTIYGTNVSLKEGIWNGQQYEDRLRIINMPVLKSHSLYGVTAAMKSYMGVQSGGLQNVFSDGLSNAHDKVGTGGMGSLMAEIGIPTLNIIDALWINANPSSSALKGPNTPNERSTRVNILAASTDPIAISFWSAKNILLPTASLIGHTNVNSLDPTNTIRGSGINTAFGVWLPKSLDELSQAGYNLTMDEERMNVYVETQGLIPDIPEDPTPDPTINSFNWVIWVMMAVVGVVSLVIILRKVRIKK